MQKLLKWVKQIMIASVLLIAVTSCGFHLRGVGSIPQPLHKLYISGNDPYSEFMHHLKNSLNNAGIEVVDHSDQSPYLLKVTNTSLSTHQTSTASSEQLRQYKVTFNAHFILQDQAHQPIVPPFSLKATQTQTMSPGELLENSPQLNQIKRDLYDKITNQLFDHLSATNVSQAIKQHQSLTATKS